MHVLVNYEPQGDKIWYFFTPRVKRYKKGSRPNRSAEDGYWKATRVEKTIKTNDDQEIGFKKTLVYYRGNNASDGVKTNWIMHEFRINGPSLLGPSLKWKRNMVRYHSFFLLILYYFYRSNSFILSTIRYINSVYIIKE